MKFDVMLHAGTERSQHQIELLPGASSGTGTGQAEFRLDGDRGEPQLADWAEVSPGVYSILLGGRSYEARIAPRSGSDPTPETSYVVTVGTREFRVEVRDPRRGRQAGSGQVHQGPQEILAPMPGRIVKILVAEHQPVSAGDGLVVIEAMKMQNELRAPRAGRVDRIYVAEGSGVETGFKLLRLL